jgi:hypothetical protein
LTYQISSKPVHSAGFCLFTKRLEHGVFLWPPNVKPDETLSLTSAQLSLLIEGVDWHAATKPMPPFLVGEPARDERKHFMLSRRQRVRIGAMNRRLHAGGLVSIIPDPRIDRFTAPARPRSRSRWAPLGLTDPLDDLANALGFA